jgi:hypothetical protein
MGRLWICVPQTQNALATVKDLQTMIRVISAQMAQSGRLDVPPDLTTLAVDGRIGPTTALGAQFITAAFAASVPPPPEVGAILERGISAEEAVGRVASAADALDAYFSNTLANFPSAVANQPTMVVQAPVRRVPTAQAAVAGVGSVALIGGLLSAARLFW